MRVKHPRKNGLNNKKSKKDKFRQVEELQITEQELQKTIKKRKNCSVPGIDQISNFWWKKLRLTWGKLATVMQAWIEVPNKVPKWLTLGRTVLIPKTEDFSCEKITDRLHASAPRNFHWNISTK